MDLRPETLIQCPRAFTYPILNVSKAEVSRRVAEAIVNVNYQYHAVFKKKKSRTRSCHAVQWPTLLSIPDSTDIERGLK